jgi:hypothetical protein
MTSKKVLFPSFRTPYPVRGRPDPESRKSLKALDPPVKPGDDDIKNFVTFYKGFFMMILGQASQIGRVLSRSVFSESGE